jgi:hypothetical protein
MANAFDDHFAAASSVFFESFGETGGVEYFATATAAAATWSDAIVDKGDLDGIEVVDAAGERVTEAAFVTIPAATTWSRHGLVRIGGEDGQKWQIVGQAIDSGSLITLALSRTSHARVSRSIGRASVRNR